MLCFDESNAELDDNTEQILFKISFEKFTNTTSFLVIANRLKYQ
jgi:ABC-type multidrug transport system fused ATPase/permease subunit